MITNSDNTGAYTEDAGGTVTDTLIVSDPDGGAVTWTCVGCADGGNDQTLTDTYGSWALTEATGVWIYTPNDSDNDLDSLNAAEAATETITATATDSDGDTDTIVITITITGANDAPTSANAADSTDEDTLVTFASSDFAFSDVDDAHTAFTRIYIAVLESSGTLECQDMNGGSGDDSGWNDCEADHYVDAGTDIRLTPATDSTAAVTFSFTVYDGTVQSADYVFTVTVNAVNDAPGNAGDTATVTEDTAYNSWTAATDWGYTDTEGTSMNNVLIWTCPSSGVLTIDGNACSAESSTATLANLDDISYAPVTDLDTGNPTFTYKVSDGNSYSAAGTMTISFSGTNDVPANAGDTATVTEEVAYTSWTAATDWGWSDVDTGDLLNTVKIIVCPSTGTMTVGGSACSNGVSEATLANLATITYAPVADQDTGTVTFTYQLGDGDGYSATGTMTMSFSGTNDVPANAGDTATVTEDTAYTSWTAATDWGWSDVDTGDLLATVKIIACLTGTGTLTVDGDACAANDVVLLNDLADISYTGAANIDTGTVTFTYQLHDGDGFSDEEEGGGDTDDDGIPGYLDPDEPCGNGVCDTGSEDCEFCPVDCPCTEGTICTKGECVLGAPVCDDGFCNMEYEDCGNCPGDCPCATGSSCVGNQCVDASQGPQCGDDQCTPGTEDCKSCPADCPCPGQTTCNDAGLCVAS